jgi:hypothetical protein
MINGFPVKSKKQSIENYCRPLTPIPSTTKIHAELTKGLWDKRLKG